MQIRIVKEEQDKNQLINRSTYPALCELREYASRRNHLPGFEVISRFIKQLDQDELTDDDVPVTRLLAAIERFEQNAINRLDLLTELLWILEGYGDVIKQSQLSQQIAEELRLLDKQAEQVDQTPHTLNLDFTEIPAANSGAGTQDIFELFARDFFLVLGYEIEEGPGRGADGGKDLLVIEPFSGILSQTKKRWVVSCKHFAHSGKAVGIDDEINITDRVKKFDADGFIAFYSTLPSSSLNDNFTRLKGNKILIEVLDKARIEDLLLSDEKLEPVIARYFGQTYRQKLIRRKERNFEKALLLLEYEKKRKQEEAVYSRDAIHFLKAEREYERKLELLKNQHHLDITYLSES